MKNKFNKTKSKKQISEVSVQVIIQNEQQASEAQSNTYKIKNKEKNRRKAKRHRANRRFVKNCFFVILGLVMIIAEFIINDIAIPECVTVAQTNLCSVICVFLSTVSSILIVSVIWESLQKKQFSKELLQTIGMTKSVIDSGIKNYHKTTEISWESSLESVRKFEMFLTFGESWVDENNSKRDTLQKYIERNSNEVIVVLPDYKNKNVVEALLVKYPKNHDKENTEQSIADKIMNTIKGLWEISAKIEVKLYPGINFSSYYFLDDVCYFSPYAHENFKGKNIPIIELTKTGENNYFYDFCRKDMDSILENSTNAQECDEDLNHYLEELKNNNNNQQ